MKELEEKGKERELEDSREEEDEAEFDRKRLAKEAFEAENKAYKERLESELTGTKFNKKFCCFGLKNELRFQFDSVTHLKYPFWNFFSV